MPESNCKSAICSELEVEVPPVENTVNAAVSVSPAGYKKDTSRGNYENIPKFARGTQRSQYI